MNSIDVKLPKPVQLPCDCYDVCSDYAGCSCFNYDNVNAQGFAQGWNACLTEFEKLNK